MDLLALDDSSFLAVTQEGREAVRVSKGHVEPLTELSGIEILSLEPGSRGVTLAAEHAVFFLERGSGRVARLDLGFQAEGIRAARLSPTGTELWVAATGPSGSTIHVLAEGLSTGSFELSRSWDLEGNWRFIQASENAATLVSTQRPFHIKTLLANGRLVSESTPELSLPFDTLKTPIVVAQAVPLRCNHGLVTFTDLLSTGRWLVDMDLSRMAVDQAAYLTAPLAVFESDTVGDRLWFFRPKGDHGEIASYRISREMVNLNDRRMGRGP